MTQYSHEVQAKKCPLGNLYQHLVWGKKQEYQLILIGVLDTTGGGCSKCGHSHFEVPVHLQYKQLLLEKFCFESHSEYFLYLCARYYSLLVWETFLFKTSLYRYRSRHNIQMKLSYIKSLFDVLLKSVLASNQLIIFSIDNNKFNKSYKMTFRHAGIYTESCLHQPL